MGDSCVRPLVSESVRSSLIEIWCVGKCENGKSSARKTPLVQASRRKWRNIPTGKKREIAHDSWASTHYFKTSLRCRFEQNKKRCSGVFSLAKPSCSWPMTVLLWRSSGTVDKWYRDKCNWRANAPGCNAIYASTTLQTSTSQHIRIESAFFLYDRLYNPIFWSFLNPRLRWVEITRNQWTMGFVGEQDRNEVTHPTTSTYLPTQ